MGLTTGAILCGGPELLLVVWRVTEQCLILMVGVCLNCSQVHFQSRHGWSLVGSFCIDVKWEHRHLKAWTMSRHETVSNSCLRSLKMYPLGQWNQEDGARRTDWERRGHLPPPSPGNSDHPQPLVSGDIRDQAAHLAMLRVLSPNPHTVDFTSFPSSYKNIVNRLESKQAKSKATWCYHHISADFLNRMSMCETVERI